MRWMVLGASPSAVRHDEPEVDIVASCGDAITLRWPDYYWITEQEALHRYTDEVAEARKRGTKVCLQKSALKAKPFVHDIAVDIQPSGISRAWRVWEPGLHVASVTGGIVVQFAVNRGATEVHMVGMEGYTGEVDYFTGRRGVPRGAELTQKSYGPLLQRIVKKCPNIQFVVYGTLNYELVGENVSHG